MKINAIGADYSALRARNLKNSKVNETIKTDDVSNIPQGMSMISFRSGNPRHIAHVVAEEPLFGFNGGGVGTVVNDYNFLDKDVDKVVKIIPMYNQQVDYKKDVDPKTGKIKQPLPQDVKVRYIPDNLPAGHPFKGKEGTPFITGKALDNATDMAKFLEKEQANVFLLEEVKTSKMNWGMEENVPIKMFKAQKDENLIKAMDKRGMSKDLQNKLEFVFTYVDSTASMPKQYADGMSYSTASGSELEKRFASGWKGQDYAKFDKATVELMPSLKEKFGIDPKYFLCSDGQSMFTMHYAAQKNAGGDSYWQDKFLGGVGHNMNRGYIQEMGARQAIVNLGATKEELNKLISSPEYTNAVKLGREEDFLRETVLKNFNSKTSGMNAFSVPIHYAKVGYSPMLTTVSEGYHDSIISNKLVSSLYSDLKELDEVGRFKAITNPLMDPNVSAFKPEVLQGGYKNDSKVKLADGTEVTVPKFQVFDKNKTDLASVREVKRQNKINLLERFNKKFINAQFYDAANKEWMAADTGRMHILTGASGRKAKIYGEISDEYLQKLKNGKDVKLVTSWGRGDFQKGMDTVIDSFEKYAAKDPDAILIFGGDMQYEPQTVEKFQLISAKPNMKGRMILMDGWTPGKDFAMASDVALLPSRFAPCELTDLEAKKCLCTPVVPNVQGMAQKNFDPSLTEEIAKADAYKGKHEYFMTEEAALKDANAEAKAEFEKTKNKLVAEIKKQYKGKVNEEIPEELLNASIEGNDKYQKALRKLRDSVISDDMAACLERALITDRNGKNAETILANQIKEDTTWFGNGWLSNTGKSAGELYQEYHFNNKGKNISKKDLITLDFSGLSKGGHTTEVTGQSVHFGGKTKKAAAIALGIAALAGIGVAGYKGGWFSPKFEEETKNGNLSCIG